MVNSSALIAVAYLTQVTLGSSNAQTDYSHLKDIVPKRDVLYVGGKYQNVTVSQRSNHLHKHQNKPRRAEWCDECHIVSYGRPNLRRKALSQSRSKRSTTSHHLHRRSWTNRHQLPRYPGWSTRMGGLLHLQRPHCLLVGPACAGPLHLAARPGHSRHIRLASRRV